MSDPHSDFTLSPSSPFSIHCPPALTRDNPAHLLLPHIYMPSFSRLPRLSPRSIIREPLDSSPRFATPQSPFSSSLSTSALSSLRPRSLSTTTTAAIIYFAPATTTISTAQEDTSSSLPHGASELLEHDILTLLLQTNVEYLSAFVRLPLDTVMTPQVSTIYNHGGSSFFNPDIVRSSLPIFHRGEREADKLRSRGRLTSLGVAG